MRRNASPRAIDLFCGAGGMTIGLQQAGFSVLGVEKDDLACLTHVREVGPVACMDVRHYSPPERGISLVTSGSPCQEFSDSGPRGGLQSPRGRLYREWIRIGVEASAPMLMMENVPEVTDMPARLGVTGQTIIDVIQEDLGRAGYHSMWAILDAMHFGLPQTRTRCFLVAAQTKRLLDAFRFPKPTHGKGLLPIVTARQASGIPYDGPAPTVTATESKSAAMRGSRGGAGAPRRSHETMVYRLGHRIERPTVAQWAALQGFPPGMQFAGTKEEQTRAVGNAVPPPLAFVLGVELRRALEHAG